MNGALLPRMRMFAGPNGSGKTTVQREIARHFPPNFLGVLINPDDLESAISRNGRLDLGQFGISATAIEAREAFTLSAFLSQHRLAEAARVIRCDGQIIDFTGLTMNSYYASVLADFLRHKLLSGAMSFSFETVMSERGKIDLLREAKGLGFRTYLYFVATEDPEINVSRVELRVSQGGHNVPKEKIVSRYFRSLEFVREAISYSHRAYFFDTSESTALFVAESVGGELPELRSKLMPNWFKTYVWDKF